jgi:pimeloyl-ACP methyl ester carboxylesterase
MRRDLTPNVTLINDKPVYYFESSEDSRHVMVILHGFMSDYRSVQPFATDLKTDAHVVLPDLPGFGASAPLGSGSKVSLDDYVSWLSDFLDVVAKDAKKLTLVGYSFGAYIAILYASRKPPKLKSMVLITPVIKVYWMVRIYGSILNALSLRSEIITRKVYTWRPQFDFTSYYLAKAPHPQRKKQLIAHRRTEVDALQPELVLSLYKQFMEIDLLAYADKVKVSTMVVIAAKDNVADNKYTRLFISQMKTRPDVVELKRVGHLVPFEEPHLLAVVVNKRGA